MNPYWKDRGFPWEYDPGPPPESRWPGLFAATPNYRALGRQRVGREIFRWYFGPMFYRGRLSDGSVRVVVIGQEGAQDEALAHRSFTGGTGSRMQHFLSWIGISESYLFLNTFVYPIFGQYSESLRWLAQDADSPIVGHRHDIFSYVVERNDVRLIVAVGNAAKESVVTWVESRGGTCPAGPSDVSLCSGGVLDAGTRIVGVMHPGASGQGGSTGRIIASFKEALAKIKAWTEEDPQWLPPDPGAMRMLDRPFKYRSAPIPFRDLAYGRPLCLGSGGTNSNRKDGQRSVQIFSENGRYDNKGVRLRYSDGAAGTSEGYAEEPGDVPYEPPKKLYLEYDRGPGERFARLFMGGEPGLEWPDFNALGATAHPSFGTGPIYRGRPDRASVLVLADQQCHDDLFTGRALTGESGQHLQAYLVSMGILESYVIIRVLPVDTLDLAAAAVRSIVTHPRTLAVYQAMVDRIFAGNDGVGLVLTVGPQARALSEYLSMPDRPLASLKAWKQEGALRDWQEKLVEIGEIPYRKDVVAPSLTYGGRRGQIPRFDLPYGTLRWYGTSGDRARRPVEEAAGRPSPDYGKVFVPDWVAKLDPLPL